MVMLVGMLSNEVAHRIVGKVILRNLESLENTKINLLELTCKSWHAENYSSHSILCCYL